MSRRGKEVRVGLTKRPAVNLNAIDQNTQNKRLKPLYGMFKNFGLLNEIFA